jgi:fibronectin type 3 domain-containing protein
MKPLFVLVLTLMLMLFPALTVQAQAATVNLAWDVPASGGAATGYNVYRSTVSGQFTTKLNATPLTTLTYADTTAVAGTTYFYVVRAVNASGESANSNQVTAAIPIPVPGAPTNLRVISIQ